MMRVTFGFDIVPLNGGETGLRVAFQAGPQAGGTSERVGMEIDVAPVSLTGKPLQGWTIAEGLEQLGDLLKIDAISQIAALKPPGPWGSLFTEVKIAPSLRIEPVGADPSIMLEAQLFKAGSDPGSGITIGGPIVAGISIEPEITVYALVVGYSKRRGLDLKARVLIHPQEDGGPARLTVGGDPKPAGKPQLISYPFPTPDQNSSGAFRLNFLGLGQRFAPTVDLTMPDPLKSAFDALEKAFASDDPETVINTLVKDYYKPDVGWFFALDLDVRGFSVMAVLADPVLYGLRIACDSGQFKGLLAEIIYQKIGADLGVFYGKIVLPASIRQIEVGVGSATIPSFQVWIYTNGDFKVAIGWPLGPDSFSLQAYIFMGSAGLYFGKLRSGDNPTGRTEPQTTYNPILVFGLALKLGVGRSITKGPISAEASLTLQGVFQGLLAWEAADTSGQTGIARQPNYYWFSASVTLAGVVQGSVDLGVISATVSISVWATIATAFETNCNTVVHAEVGVDVSVSIKVVFFRIRIHFSATLDLSFTLIGGHDKDAQVDGPSDPDLRAFIPQSRSAGRPLPNLRMRALAVAPEAPLTVDLSFVLQPAVPYDLAGAGQIGAVATLLIASPNPDDLPRFASTGTDFAALVDYVTPKLLTIWGKASWAALVEALGVSGQPVPVDFESKLSQLLADVTFRITGVDLSRKDGASADVAIFPMLDPLTLTAGGTSWTFGTDPLTSSGYPAALAAYFQDLSALTPNAPDAGGDRATVADVQDGPSLSHLLFVNWFLSLARQIASTMADHEKNTGSPLAADAGPAPATVTAIAGMLSRMALHGSRLPDPAVVHTPRDPITEEVIHPLYGLDHQQLTAAAGVAIQATLSASAGGLTIVFAADDHAVAVLPGGTAPQGPDPGWHAGLDDKAGLAVSAIDPLVRGPLTFAVASRTEGDKSLFPGRGSDKPAQVLALPASARAHVAVGGLSGTLRVRPEPASVATPFAPGLLVPMGLRRVPIVVESNLKPTPAGPEKPPSVVSSWAKSVYSLIGTDDDTRDLLEQAIDGGKVRRIVPLTLDANTLTLAAPDKTSPVLAFKSNLSTTSQPNVLMALQAVRRRQAGDDLGPVSAPIDDVGGFLRLVWEASVVHTSGFFLNTPGNDLPAASFDKDVARFWLWLDLGDEGETGTIPAYANSLVIAGADDASKSTQYLSLADAAGPITGWHPSYPPGCVGAELRWNAPPEGDGTLWSPASVAALYHLIQMQLGGAGFSTTLWSTPLSPVEQDQTNGVVRSATYRQVAPVWTYLKTPASSPYAAVGTSAQLAFRLCDVYGNALVDPKRQYSASFPVQYNDPLLGPSTWPGCQAAYDIGQDATTKLPNLTISVTIDTQDFQAQATKLRALENGKALATASLQAARDAWAAIANQAHDPNFLATASSTLYGDADDSGAWPTVGDDASTLAQVKRMIDAIHAFVQGDNTGKLTEGLTLPLDLDKIARRPSDIFPLGVRLSLYRDKAKVDPAIAAKLPSVQRVDALLPPLLLPPSVTGDRTRSSDTDTPAPLVIWSKKVEQVLKNFDGDNGQVKLAQRPMSAADDAADGPGLWAVRLSSKAGIDVVPGKGEAAFFTLQPFSTSLQYGAVDKVTTWNGDLEPATSTSSAASVDPDVLARGFLAGFDRLMAPDLAAGIARIDGATTKGAFATLMDHKATVASVLSKRLIPVYEQQAGGDPNEAATQFEQSLLARLSNAYATAAVVQVPLEVSMAGTAEAAATLPPRMFGALSTGTTEAEAATSPALAYTLTSPKLALDGTPSQWLTFMSNVREPDLSATLELQPTWMVSHIEHEFEPKEKLYGYLPSSWLKFIAPDTTTASLNVPLGSLSIPVPLRQYPALPVLLSQVATAPNGRMQAAPDDDSIPDAIAKALRWPLTLTIEKAEEAAQDDLWVTSTFNQGLDWRPERADGPGPITPLTAALVRFQIGFDSLSPHLALLDGSDPQAGQLIDALVKLVGDVVSALQPASGFAGPPEVERLIWVLRYANVQQGKIDVFCRAEPAGAERLLRFPTIRGLEASPPPRKADPAVAPDENAWMVMTYALSEADGQLQGQMPSKLEFAIDDLDLLSQQTVIGSARVTRNAFLGNARVNAKLVYQTPEMFFGNVLVPSVDVARTLGPMPAAPLEQMLTSVLAPFKQVGSATGQARIIRIAFDYAYPLVPGAGADPLMATTSAVMNAGEALAEDASAFVKTLCHELRSWYGGASLPGQGSTLRLSLSLFMAVAGDGAGKLIPLLSLRCVELALPADWYDGGQQ